MTPRSARRALAILGGVAACALVLPTSASAAGSPTAFTEHKTVTRVNLIGGHNTTVDSRTFSLSVSQTANLDGNQEIDVSWTGARPTGGIFPDQNSDGATQEEYPVVLLECRGQDSTALPAAQQLSPNTCWTAGSDERYQESFSSAFPPWRLDRYATAAQSAAVAGMPAKVASSCNDGAPAQYWVPFVAGNGTTYGGGPNGCGGMAPEASNVGGLNLPSNETYAVTGTDGTGNAKFDVWTDEENASLGCSDTVACALVAVPVMGISCDVTSGGTTRAGQAAPDQADDTLCEGTGAFTPGELAPTFDVPDVSVSGSLWWAASNWRNRITVPLSFAPPSNICEVTGKTGGVDLYGSEVMSQAFLQWSPHFCLDKSLFDLKLVQTAEPEARNLLATGGGVEAAVGSQMPSGGYATPVVDAPIALTGFAITFDIDDAHGQAVSSLRLTPRLLAKLLTESYPSLPLVRQSDKALADNPLDISVDPEFTALNPGISGSAGVDATESASTLLALSSQSDVMHALTSYINSDPEARSWLNGTPDPWGMVVNPAYKGIVLPTNSWPLLDTFEAPFNTTQNPCLFDSPVPYLPLVAAPQSTLANIALDMQFGLARSDTVCNQPIGTSVGEKLEALGRQNPGFRFMIGVTSLAEADIDQLDTASLQTLVAPGSPAKLTSAAGRTFVAPGDTSLEAAAKLLTPNTATQSWPIPYQTIGTSAAASGAYPGTMVVYAQIPTSGLPAADASDYAQFLTFAGSDGQVRGTGNGQLPDGYLPLTAANSLGSLASYTKAAAAAVAAQKGTVPPLVTTAAAPPTTAAASGSPPAPKGSSVGASTYSGAASSPAGPDTSTAVAPDPVESVSGILGFVGNTISQISDWAGAIVPLLFVLAALGGLGALFAYAMGRRRAKRAQPTSLTDMGAAPSPLLSVGSRRRVDR